MTKSVEELLSSFEKLPEAEKRELASEIIKRSLTLDLPEIPDDSLLSAADQIFLQLEGAFDAQSLVTIPHAKLIRKIGTLPVAQLAEVERAVAKWLGLESQNPK